MLQVGVAILLAIGASVPLWRLARRRWSMRIAALLLTASAVATIVATAARRPGNTSPSSTRPLEVAAHDDGYIGSQTCRACHPAEHASWHGSFHRTMTQVVDRGKLVAEFEQLEVDWFDKRVALEWRGDKLWVRFVRGGARPGPVEAPIEQMTGSHNLQVLWYATGQQRELAPVPVCYHIEEQRWLPLTSVFVLPPEFHDPPEPGVWNRSCAMCHTTDPRPRVDRDRADTHVGEFGVACEACHGPGAEHAASNRNPLTRYARRLAGGGGDGDGGSVSGDASIANPAGMPPARSAETCGQCHSVHILREQHFDSWREEGSPFVPGSDLQESHLVIGPEHRDAPELRHELRRNSEFFRGRFWPDGQVRLSGREFSGLRRSPCYQHGDQARQMDCTSCHAMHTEDGSSSDRWRKGQMKPEMLGNAACTQCHDDYADAAQLAQHTGHAPGSSGSSCYDCHMSYTSVGLMKASRSHEITSPDVAVELRTGRPNACNQCHLDQTLAWTAKHLASRYGIAVPELDEDQRTVAASVRWLLTGDAGQRMLAAWSFGQPWARQASGEDWMAPHLARLLDDPYYVVRFNAERSLRALGGSAYGGSLAGYSHLAESERVAPFVDKLQSVWQSRYTGGERPAVLMAARGLDAATFQRLYARRDDRPVYIAE
ncbi:MAG: ammonia-forming cytochrome c nitrite reductase subunit c552 [Planctomycetota bacterium]